MIIFAVDAAHATDFQPFAAHSRRVVEALDFLGEPLANHEKATLLELASSAAPEASDKIEALLDTRCLFLVEINPEMRVKVARGPAKAELVEGGWRLFLIKVRNASGTTAPLRAISPEAQKLSNDAFRPPDAT